MTNQVRVKGIKKRCSDIGVENSVRALNYLMVFKEVITVLHLEEAVA